MRIERATEPMGGYLSRSCMRANVFLGNRPVNLVLGEGWFTLLSEDEHGGFHGYSNVEVTFFVEREGIRLLAEAMLSAVEEADELDRTEDEMQRRRESSACP